MTIQSPTGFNRLSNFCSGYDEFHIHEELHRYQCYSSSTPFRCNKTTEIMTDDEEAKDLILPQKPYEEKSHLTSVTDIKDYGESYTYAIHVDNSICPFDYITNGDETSITYISSSEDPTSFQQVPETSSPNVTTSLHEFHYTESEKHDETSINDLCDSSTYDIAQKF